MADDRPDDWPSGVAAPARRALTAAGYTGLEQLAAAQVDDLAALHGIGRRPLRDALAERGLGFAPSERHGKPG